MGLQLLMGHIAQLLLMSNIFCYPSLFPKYPIPCHNMDKEADFQYHV